MAPAPDARQDALHAELLAALGPDPYLRFELDPGTLDEVAVLPGRAAAWVGVHRSGVRWCTGLAADPSDAEHVRDAAALVASLVDRTGPVLGVTVTRGGRALLPEPLRAPEAWEWDYWWTETAPEMSSYAVTDVDVVDLDPDDPRIPVLLDAASPSAPVAPGDPRVVRWAGVEVRPSGGGAGAFPESVEGLAALLAVTRHRSGADHLNDVATHPAWRGRRLARLLCATVTADSLAAGRPAVTLGMYADNEAARRVYAAIGFRFVRGQTSGRLAAPA